MISPFMVDNAIPVFADVMGPKNARVIHPSRGIQMIKNKVDSLRHNVPTSSVGSFMAGAASTAPGYPHYMGQRVV